MKEGNKKSKNENVKRLISLAMRNEEKKSSDGF